MCPRLSTVPSNADFFIWHTTPSAATQRLQERHWVSVYWCRHLLAKVERAAILNPLQQTDQSVVEYLGARRVPASIQIL